MSFDPDLHCRLAGRHELLTAAEMAQADAAAPALGVPGPVLMEAAGRAVARSIRQRFAPCRVLVLAGPGNNGGDGYVVARLLQQEGWPVQVAALAPPRAGSDAAGAAARWHGPMAPFTPDAAARAALVVDAVFGAGLTRDVDGIVAATLQAAPRVVAVDVPSGVDGADGRVRGFAPQAELTVTFFRLKPGHLMLPGRDLCGRIALADIGLPPAVLSRIKPATMANVTMADVTMGNATMGNVTMGNVTMADVTMANVTTAEVTMANVPALWPIPRPGSDAHKYTRGHVTVLGGAVMTGAARLAAEAARRGGAGLVTIAALGSADVYRTGAPGALVSEAPVAELLGDPRRQVWVCGPGLGPEAARRLLPPLLAAKRTIVGDADIFSAFAAEPDALRGAAVLTPHDGEFARAFGRPKAGRLAAARDAAARTGSVVLLKGPDTVIAAPDGRAAINASAPPWLATAGAGDVLAGLIAALLAQGMPAWEAAAAAAWLHGRAAVHAGPGMVVEDLLPALKCALDETIHPQSRGAVAKMARPGWRTRR